MFAAIPPLIGLLIRYYLTTEAIKFATGTQRKDWIKMSLDLSEQIGNPFMARLSNLASGRETPAPFDPNILHPSTGTLGHLPQDLMLELVTAGSGIFGAPGNIAEALGYTFPGEAAKQRQRLEAEVRGGFPFTRKRIKGAPEFVKRKLSTWNRDVKKAYAEVKKQKNQFGPKGRITVPKKAFPKIVKIVSEVRKGKKQKTKGGKQIAKVIKKIVPETIKKTIRRTYR